MHGGAMFADVRLPGPLDGIALVSRLREPIHT